MNSNLVPIAIAFQIPLQTVGNIVLSNVDITRIHETIFNLRLNHGNGWPISMGFLKVNNALLSDF